MKLTPQKLVQHFDWVSFVTILILMSLSLIMLYSIALGSDDPVDYLNFKKQVVFAGVSVLAYIVIAFLFDYRFLRKLVLPLSIIGALSLVLLFFFGTSVRGTTGWFIVGPLSIQPVEFVKIIAVIFLAWYLTYYGKFLNDIRYVVGGALGVGVFIVLVLLQPDFGSAMILVSVWIGMMLLSGMLWRYVVGLVGLGIGSLAVLWQFIFEEYQKNRIRVFLDPSIDPLGTGYNVTQAIIAVGSGRWFGRGLSFGSQSKLKFLPEAQTDFIFAVIAEQLGFVGVIVLLSLFCVLFWRMIVIAKESRDNFATYLVIGICIVVFVQMMINISMNIGLMPVTGLPLPLISYGGSSLLATLLMLGLVQNVAMRKRV